MADWAKSALLAVVLLIGGCSQAPESQAEAATGGDFVVEVLVDDVPNARSLAWGEQGTLFVGSRRAGNVYAIRNPLSDNPQTVIIASGLNMPNGVAFRDGALYVAEPRRILRFPDIEARLDNPPAAEVAVAELPYGGPLHSWKYLRFGPDGRLYVPIGAPCNVCDREGYGLILSMRPDGSDRRIEAKGVRNSVGFDWHPGTGDLWFTDNGRDMLGDDVPPCELNRVATAGQDFGFPYCHGGDISDPEFGSLGSCDEAVPPVQRLAPHSAPLGMVFYTGEMFPPRYRGQVLVAEHGSWNRSKAAGKTGYRISLVSLDGNRAVGYEPFLEGFLDGQQVIGRPVDLLLAPDGSLLISDDERGLVLRVSYPGGNAGSAG